MPSGVHLFDGEAWRRHKAMPLNRRSKPSDFEEMVSKEGAFAGFALDPKATDETTLGCSNRRGAEVVYVFDAKTGRFKVAVGSG